MIMDYDAKIRDALSKQSHYLTLSQSQQSDITHFPEKSNSSKTNQCPVMTIEKEWGRKLVFDNIDYSYEVHHMTEEHQNVDCHYMTTFVHRTESQEVILVKGLKWRVASAFHQILKM